MCCMLCSLKQPRLNRFLCIRMCPTSEVDVVDQHHGHFRVQVLHHILNLVLCFACNQSVDLCCGLGRFGKVDVEDLTGVVVLDILQERCQRSEACAHRGGVTDIQLLLLLAVAEHVEKMLVSFVDLCLGLSAVAQAGEQLPVGFTAGPRRQHGQSGGDAQRRVEDVLPSSSFGTQTFVEGEGEVGIGRGQHVAAHFSLVAVVVVVTVTVTVTVVMAVVMAVVPDVVICPGCSQQQRCECTTSKDTTHLYSLSRKQEESAGLSYRR